MAGILLQAKCFCFHIVQYILKSYCRLLLGLGDASIAIYEFRSRQMLFGLNGVCAGLLFPSTNKKLWQGHNALVNQVHFPGPHFVRGPSYCSEGNTDRTLLFTAGNDSQACDRYFILSCSFSCQNADFVVEFAAGG